MDTDYKIKGLTRLLIWFVIFVHFMFFLLESILWMRPEVHVILIDLLNNPVASGHDLQALTLKNLFVNQGYYNLFLVVEGLVGLYLIKKGKISFGYLLLSFLCFSAVGAGIVLACSTKAYILALLQATPAAITFARLYPDLKNSWQKS